MIITSDSLLVKGFKYLLVLTSEAFGFIFSPLSTLYMKIAKLYVGIIVQCIRELTPSLNYAETRGMYYFINI